MAPSYKGAHTTYGGKEIYKHEYEILTNPNWKSHLEWKASSGHSAPSNAVAGGTDAGKEQSKYIVNCCKRLFFLKKKHRFYKE